MGLSAFTSSTQHSLQELQLRGSLLVPDQIQYFIALKILCIGKFGEMAALPEWLVTFPLFNSCILWIARTCCICPPRKPCNASQLKTLMIYGSPNLNIERSKVDHIPFVDIQING
ncbi:hypothetical protein CFP56_010751 [Quercus suber]|uniref:Uncharacterized protein n=1 Tax=Quercus suber TaxID=58331 RepID=A0AAW0KYS7_QUESU